MHGVMGRSKLRSFPRKRDSRATIAARDLLLWVPAFAGTNGQKMG